MRTISGSHTKFHNEFDFGKLDGAGETKRMECLQGVWQGYLLSAFLGLTSGSLFIFYLSLIWSELCVHLNMKVHAAKINHYASILMPNFITSSNHLPVGNGANSDPDIPTYSSFRRTRDTVFDNVADTGCSAFDA